MQSPPRVLIHVTLSLLMRSHLRHHDNHDDVQERRWALLPASKDVRMQHPANLLAHGAIRADEDNMAGDTSDSGDTDLILAAQADIAAFDALYDRYLPRVYRY